MKRQPFRPIEDGSNEESQARSRKTGPVAPKMLLPGISQPGSGRASTTEEQPAGSPSTGHIDAVEEANRSELTSHRHDLMQAYEVVYISALDIDVNKFAPREIYSDTTLQERADSLEANGQRDPIHVIPNPDKPGRYIIGDGWTRVQAVRMRDILGLKLKAIIHKDKSEEEIAWVGYAQNEEREAHTDYDRACFYQKWRDKGWTWEQISKKVGIPVGSLSQYSNYSKLDVDLLHYAKRHPEKVTVNVVNQLSRLVSAKGSPDAALAICKSFIEHDESFRWLKERVEALTKDSPSARKSNPVKFQRRYERGHFKQRSDGKIEIVGSIPPGKLEEFNQMMDKILRPYFGSAEQNDDSQSPGSEK